MLKALCGSRFAPYLLAMTVDTTDWTTIGLLSFTAFAHAFHGSAYGVACWPYMKKVVFFGVLKSELDPNLSDYYSGYKTAAWSIGSALSGPLVGWWSNRIHQFKYIVQCCSIFSDHLLLSVISSIFPRV